MLTYPVRIGSALVLGLGMLLAGAPVAGAASFTEGASSVAPSQLTAKHGDACTGVPDSGPGFDFHEPCHRHDDCYDNPPRGRTHDGRLEL